MQIHLRDSTPVPAVGLGFWKIPGEQTAEITKQAIQAGYRHLDCACDYGNEAQAGEGIASAISDGSIQRDDLWVTSKLWNTYHHPDHVAAACERSLKDLQLDHLDLYHIHFPISQKFVDFDTRYPPEWFFDPDAENPVVQTNPVPIVDTWGAMTRLVERGLVRHIGVCNFGVSLIRDLMHSTDHAPEMLQVELHPRLQQNKLLRFAREQSIAVTAFSPLGAPSYIPLGMAAESDDILQDETIRDIANQHGKTPAQVVLRWGLQRGTAVIPKTQTPERLKENLAATEFQLTDDQMEIIGRMDQHRRYNDPGDFAEAAFNTFYPIFE